MTLNASLPEPAKLYVIGDIHGRCDLLDRAIVAIARDLAVAPTTDCLTVTIGDYIDRGPDPRRVIERLIRNPFPTKFVPLKGNHEDWLLRFLEDPGEMDAWRREGGLETLHSYGIDVGPLMRGQNFKAAAEALRAALPSSHVAFLASLKTSLTVGRYFLCHAGVRPGVALSRQRDADLMWIRDDFLNSTENFGKIVVHGHSPAEDPEVRPNRVNVDTGAFITGRLTCAVFEQGEVRFLTAR